MGALIMMPMVEHGVIQTYCPIEEIAYHPLLFIEGCRKEGIERRLAGGKPDQAPNQLINHLQTLATDSRVCALQVKEHFSPAPADLQRQIASDWSFSLERLGGADDDLGCRLTDSFDLNQSRFVVGGHVTYRSETEGEQVLAAGTTDPRKERNIVVLDGHCVDVECQGESPAPKQGSTPSPSRTIRTFWRTASSLDATSTAGITFSLLSPLMM